MRDLDQLRERGEETAGRKLGLFALAGVLTVAAVFAMGIMVGRGNEGAPEAAPDPLAQLALPAAKAEGTPDKPHESAVDVRPESLSFPSTLAAQDEDPAVEAAVRAAAAEHELLSRGRGAANGVPPIPIGDLPAAMPSPPPSSADLPALSTASGQAGRLERVAVHDPLVARALPGDTSGQTLAPAGKDGAFVLQVVSYESQDQAERFAKTLRARNHKAFVTEADVEGRGRFYRVRIGPFETRGEAKNYQGTFESAEHMHTIMVANTAH